ncbi:ribokinase [Tichowtungia aerotolerans]|uniref:Ribokinase n=1 Tax=Tichowtungia aerotolerans TaxID=2697043 RepID=A0A6P1M8V4_9BACT|nr:ribokinase [Tichowtungia aerotolerans]QHI68538.1 ribokinase [Tichowtungia aerotolerans]
MAKVVVVGSSNTDMVVKSNHLPVPGETILGGEFLMNPGGKGANQAVAARRLGAEVVFVARVGDDIFGRESVQGFGKEKINTDFIAVDAENPSGVAVIMVDEKGENCIAVASGANHALSAGDVDKAVVQIESASVLLMQLESPLATVEHAAALGAKKGKCVILNPAPAQSVSDELLANLDFITPNETEAEILTGIKVTDQESAQRAAEVLRGKGVGTVVVTLGSRGAYVQSEALSVLVPARNVDAVDTTAAGDTFNGALAVGLADGLSIEAAVGFANQAAAISVTRMGAQSSAPFLNELEL